MVKTRFGNNRFVEFKMPDKQARKRILQLLIKKFSCSEEVLDKLAGATEGISPRDLTGIIKLVELNVACENKGRTHFEFADFKEEIDRCKAANKEEGTLNKMAKNVKTKAVEDPVGFWSQLGCFGVAVGTCVGNWL